MKQIKLIFLMLGLLSFPVGAASIYVYTDSSGNRLITDHPRDDLPGYSFVKKYTADDYFGLADRPGANITSHSLSPRPSQFDSLIFRNPI